MALILDEMLAISPLRTVNQIAAVVCNTSDEVFRSVQIHHACLLPTYHHALGFLEAKEQSLANRFAKLNGSEHSRLNLVRAALNVFHDFVRQQDQQHMRLALSTEFI